MASFSKDTLEALAAAGQRPETVKDDDEWLVIAYEILCFKVARFSGLPINDPIHHYGHLRGEIVRRMKGGG